MDGDLLSNKSLIHYPHNPEFRYSWVHRRNTAFDNLTPLKVMKAEGIKGMARVARYLNFVCGI